MNIEITNEINLMIKYGLSYEEINIIKLLFIAQEDRTEFIGSYYSECKPEKKLRQILCDLQEKKIILKSYKIPETGSEFDANAVIFNSAFLKSFLRHSNDMGEELLAAYPPFIVINDGCSSLKNISKHYHSMEDFCFAYGKSIKFDPKLHTKILATLRKATEENLINSNICDFVISRKWKDLMDLSENKIELNGSYSTAEIM